MRSAPFHAAVRKSLRRTILMTCDSSRSTPQSSAAHSCWLKSLGTGLDGPKSKSSALVRKMKQSNKRKIVI